MSQTGRPRNAGIACTPVSQGTLELRTHRVYQSITSRKISLFSKWRVQNDDTHTLSLSHSDTTLDVSRTSHCDLHQWQVNYQLILICCSVIEAAKKRHFFHDIFLSPLLNFFLSVTLAATGVHLFFQVRRQISTHLLKFVILLNLSCLPYSLRQVSLLFSSSSFWPQLFKSLSFCSSFFTELFPVCHTGRDRCTLVFSSSSTDFHPSSQVRHTHRNSLTPFPFAPFFLLNFFLSVTLAATGVHLVFSSSSTDFHSPSQVRHTDRNYSTPFPFAPFFLLNFFLSVTLAATGVHLFFQVRRLISTQLLKFVILAAIL